MNTAFKSILRIVGNNIFNIEPNVPTGRVSDTTTKELFVIAIGLEPQSNLLLESHLISLGISPFSINRNYQSKSKLKALAHAGKIKYSPNESALPISQKEFYWDQIFETRKKIFNGFIGISAMNFCVDIFNYYNETHDCRVIFLDENTKHWHRPVFNNLYNLEKLGVAKDELDYLLYPQIEMIRQLTSNYGNDIEATKKQSQNAFEKAISELKIQIPAHQKMDFNLNEGINPLSQFLGIKPKYKVFGWK